MLKNLKDKIIAEFLLLMVIILLPYNLRFSSGTIFLLLIFLVIRMNKNVYLQNLKANYRLLITATYFIFILLGLIYTSDIAYGLQKTVTQLSLLIAPLVILFINPGHITRNRFKKFFVYTMLLFSLISLFTLGYNYSIYPDERLHYNFIQRSMYHFHFPYDALYLNIAFIFLLFSNLKSAIKIAISFIFIIILLLFGVRMGLFLFIYIAIFYGILNFKRLLNLKNILLLGFLIVFSFFLIQLSPYANDKFYDTLEKIGFNTKSKVSNIGETYHNIGQRAFVWKESVNLILKSPVYGYGTGGDIEMLNKSYLAHGRDDLLNINPHNQYLSSTLHYGIFGALWLLFLIYYILNKGIRLRNYEAILFITTVMLSLITESFFERQKGVMFISLFYALILLDILALEREKSTQTELN